jgi:acyl carrier protein
MTREEIRDIVLHALGEIAPEIDLTEVRPDVDFRDQFDLDSMDLLNFVVAVDEGAGVEIPESEYARLSTVDLLVDYISEHQGALAASA